MCRSMSGLTLLSVAILLWAEFAIGISPEGLSEEDDGVVIWALEVESDSPGQGPAHASIQGRVDVYAVGSRESEAERRLFVLLPPTYARTEQERYPVIYANDGQDLFTDELASGGEEWFLDELLAREPADVQPMIIVAIEAGAFAVREFAPPGSRPDALGDDYVEFVSSGIKPFIDRTYRTLPDRAHCFVMGQGASALLAVYAAWSRASLYAGAIAFEFPDVDAASISWLEKAPTGPRPWVWLEQRAAEKSRASNTQLLTDLRAGADVQVLVAGPEALRPARVLAALRALPDPGSGSGR